MTHRGDAAQHRRGESQAKCDADRHLRDSTSGDRLCRADTAQSDRSNSEHRAENPGQRQAHRGCGPATERACREGEPEPPV
jgi:hypothetical protein